MNILNHEHSALDPVRRRHRPGQQGEFRTEEASVFDSDTLAVILSLINAHDIGPLPPADWQHAIDAPNSPRWHSVDESPAPSIRACAPRVSSWVTPYRVSDHRMIAIRSRRAHRA